MPTAKRTSKKARPPAAGEVEREMLERINATKFDRSGLRIHTAPLARDEYDFRDVESWEARAVFQHEYSREIRRNYDASRIYYEAAGGSRRAQKEMVNWKFPAPNPLPYDLIHPGLFPMPWLEYRRIMGQGEQPVIDCMGAVWEVDQEWFDWGMESEETNKSFHRLRLDWSRGRDAIKKDFSAWLDGMSKGRKTIQRRAKGRVIEDRLDQLVAWRAHRAGLNHAAFTALSPRTPYADATAFRRAHEKADKILRSFNDAAWLKAQKESEAYFRRAKKG
jgi:hypothetical protein